MDLLHDLNDPSKWSSDPNISLLYVGSGKGFYGKYNPDSTILFSKKHLDSFNNKVDILNSIVQKENDISEEKESISSFCIELILKALHYQKDSYLLPEVLVTNNYFTIPMVIIMILIIICQHSICFFKMFFFLS